MYKLIKYVQNGNTFKMYFNSDSNFFYAMYAYKKITRIMYKNKTIIRKVNKT